MSCYRAISTEKLTLAGCMGLKRFTAPQYNFSTNSSIKLTLVTVTWDEKVEEKQNKTSRILLKDLKTVCQCFIYLVATLENGLQ